MERMDRVATVMVAVALSLLVASLVHLTGHVEGRSKPFNPEHAGVAEAIIAAVVLSGASAVRRGRRSAGLAALAFAILGFCVGLNFTVRGGHLPDIAYHLILLPALVAALTVLVRTPVHDEGHADARAHRRG